MNLRDLLIRHEGMKLKPYLDCVGKLTIGAGRNLDDVGISQKEAEMLLENDIERSLALAESAFDWFYRLSPVRQDVILSMIFNLGIHGFLGFKKMIQAISIYDYELASREMLDSKWAGQVGKRAYELSEMMRTNEYLKIQGGE